MLASSSRPVYKLVRRTGRIYKPDLPPLKVLYWSFIHGKDLTCDQIHAG